MYSFLQNKYFGVVGLGVSGSGAVKFLYDNHANFIFWDDSKPALLNSLKPRNADPSDPRWQEVDFVIKSPGIMFTNPLIQKLQGFKKANILSDIELLYKLAPDSIFIGITGTNGKSTTTDLIYNILSGEFDDVRVGGNIGNAALSLLTKKATNKTIFVLELSSYQLEIIRDFKCNCAILLNITADHIDHHGSMDAYVSAKSNIFNNMQKNDFAAIGIDTADSAEVYKSNKGKISNYFSISTKNKNADIYINEKSIFDKFSNQVLSLPILKNLVGDHNKENIAAAYVACVLFAKLEEDKFINSLLLYKGLEHRLENFAEFNNSNFINDSKATNVDSTQKALASINSPIIWIAGGLEKENADYQKLKKFAKNIYKCLLIGSSAQNLYQTFMQIGFDCLIVDNIENAVNKAFEIIEGNKDLAFNVLLSPACASFDQWKNFEHRGKAFKDFVNARINEKLNSENNHAK